MTHLVHLESDARFREHAPGLPAAVEAVLSDQATPPGEVTVVLADEPKMRALHRRFLGMDSATDVLAFPSGETNPETGLPYYGDVVVAVPVARRQAEARGHSLQDELTLLVVHGVLHLLGYDHADPRQAARMWRTQARILHELSSPLAREEPRR